MTPETTDKVEKAAENALLKLAARLCMIAVLPVGGFLGGSVLMKVDRTAESTIRLEESVKGLERRFDSRFDAQGDRISDHDRRIGKLEDWRNSAPTMGRP